jgi:hypothetical protein
MYKSILILVFLLPLKIWAGFSIKFSDEPQFELLRFEGEIMENNGELRKQWDAISQLTGQKNVVLLVVSSWGGSVYYFKKLIRDIRSTCNKKRKSRCHLTSIFISTCGSACTHFPLLSDYAIATTNARFGFHRTYLSFFPLMCSETKRHLARRYIKCGGNAGWFKKNYKKLASNQFFGYWLSQNEELESGLIDKQLSSYKEFLDYYPSIPKISK